jgi:MoaA/NifB/PqqE/SkfB family radical SAM enzyme
LTIQAPAPLYLAPSWIGIDNSSCLELIDGRDGASLELTGSLRDAFLEGRLLDEPSAQAMVRLSPLMGRLIGSLAVANPELLDRHQLLRGSGWSRLFIELTGQCNERCSHCYASASPDVAESLGEDLVIETLGQARELGFTSVQLTGGDPLLADTCLPAARKARELGFPVIEIYTNGLALTDRLLQELAELEVCFAFSIYGQDPLVHDVVTQVSGSHRRTLDAVERTVKADLEARVGIIDTGQTGFNLEATVDLLVGLGVSADAIGFDVQREVGRGNYQSAAQDSELPKAGDLAPLLPDELTGVFAGTAAVSYDGYVYPCIFSRDLPLGCIGETGLAAILQDPGPVNARMDDLLEIAAGWADRLTCWKCRIRAAMLSKEPAHG